MKIAYNPKTGAALTTAPANNDITFDLSGLNIFVRGEKFKGTDTTYSVFKKHTSSSGGGYNGLVPVPSYTTTNIRFLREDGTWKSIDNYLYTQIINQDLNTLKTEGKWYYAGGGNTTTNIPSGVEAYELYVGRNANGYRYLKLTTSDGKIWFRYHNASSWTSWVRWYTDANTDLKVLLSASTTSNFRPVVLGYNNNTDKSVLANNVTNLVYTTTTIYAQPSTGALHATKFIGKIDWSNIDGKPSSFTPATHYHSYLKGWSDTRNVATTPNDYNGYFKVVGIKTAGTTLGLNSTQAGSYATIIGWRGWMDNSGGYAWEIASTDKNRLYVRSGSTTTWNNGWSAIAYTTDTYPTSQINKLTGYSKATTIASLTSADTLNTALGKLEFKTDFIYNDLFGTDNDDVINKWHEIVDFIDSVKEGTDITDEFVTRKTALTITSAKTFNNQTKFGGNSKNGSGSVYLWDSAIYRNPGSYSPQVFIRNDNASTGINGFLPALLLYNNDGALNSTIGIEFGTLEQKGSSGTVNGVALGGIIAIKESEGSGNKWSLGGLDFFVKNNKDRIDAFYIKSNGNVGIGTISPYYKLHVNGNILATKFVTSGGTSSLFVKGDGSLDSTSYATASSLGNYLPLTGGTLTGNLWFGAGDTDKYITFTSATTGKDSNYSWRIGYLGTGSGDGNHFVLQSTKSTTNTWTTALSITNVNLTATFAGQVTATSGVLIGSTADIGWYLNSSRICAGNSRARGVNVGSLLVSSAWADSSKVPTNGIYSKGNVSSAGFVKSGSSNSYVLLGGGGHKSISDFMLKSEELTTNLTTITKSLNVTQAWMDTGITSTNLPANGTYIVLVQVNANDSTGNMYSCYSSGVMSWYKDATNDSETDEIILHRSGHGYRKTIYLRTVMQSSGVLKLLIGASSNIGKSYTYTFKFKRII